KLMKSDDGVYLFKFSSKSGMEQVLERGPWMICKSPVILNKWSSSMSLKKERIGFSRALIEVSSESDLKNGVIMAIPHEEGDHIVFIKEVIRVEYEWNPPHYVKCKFFEHSPTTCPNHVKEVAPKASSMATNKTSPMEDHEEGFVEVKNQKKKGKAGSNQHHQIRKGYG
nr:hypothetical protein [Tanacetum cinerariifolium]